MVDRDLLVGLDCFAIDAGDDNRKLQIAGCAMGGVVDDLDVGFFTGPEGTWSE